MGRVFWRFRENVLGTIPVACLVGMLLCKKVMWILAR
jgi:hypothetical protein